MRRLTKSEFISKSILIHGDKYDYSKVDYVNNYTKVKIICHKHGVFEQTPNNHLNGKGCPYCKNEAIAIRSRLTTDEFIAKAKAVHGDKYDYSMVEYVKARVSVLIRCNIHGIFSQKPNDHLSGCGCPKCGINKLKTHGKSNTSIYKVHSGMLERCFNPNHNKYSSYGEIGISVCDDWRKFENFYLWAINNGYKEGLTIERIDVNGNYEPSNCKFITQHEQYYNQRRTKYLILPDGTKISLSELCDRLNLKRSAIYYQYSKNGSESVLSFLKNKCNIDVDDLNLRMNE